MPDDPYKPAATEYIGRARATTDGGPFAGAGGHVGFHGPITTEGAATFGPYSQAVNAENFYQGAEFRDRFQDGLRRLEEGMYPAAIDNFSRYLDGETGDAESAVEPTRAARAYLYIAICQLAKAPASYHPPGRIADVANNLTAATAVYQPAARHQPAVREALAALLAALVLDDYYYQDGMRAPTGLVDLASDCNVNELSTEDVTLVATHVAPCFGSVWTQFAYRAAALGVAVPPYQAEDPLPVAEEARRTGVPKYFLPTPVPPKVVSNTGAIVMLAGSGVLGLLALVVLVSTDSQTVGLALLLALVAGGLLIGSISGFHQYGAYQIAHRAYLLALQQAEPKPSDEQMDSWLRQDTERILRVGARRHRLSERDTEHGGALLLAPMLLIGVSRRQRTAWRWRAVPSTHDPAIMTWARELATVDLAQVRKGRDGFLRADFYHVLAIYLTPHRMCVYEVELDLATRRFDSERTESFHYDDVVSVATESRPASTPVQDFVNLVLGETWSGPAANGEGGSQPAHAHHFEVIEDERFTLSIIDGHQISVAIGLSVRGTTHLTSLIKWGNHNVRRVVERMVWSRKDAQIRR